MADTLKKTGVELTVQGLPQYTEALKRAAETNAKFTASLKATISVDMSATIKQSAAAASEATQSTKAAAAAQAQIQRVLGAQLVAEVKAQSAARIQADRAAGAQLVQEARVSAAGRIQAERVAAQQLIQENRSLATVRLQIDRAATQELVNQSRASTNIRIQQERSIGQQLIDQSRVRANQLIQGDRVVAQQLIQQARANAQARIQADRAAAQQLIQDARANGQSRVQADRAAAQQLIQDAKSTANARIQADRTAGVQLTQQARTRAAEQIQQARAAAAAQIQADRAAAAERIAAARQASDRMREEQRRQTIEAKAAATPAGGATAGLSGLGGLSGLARGGLAAVGVGLSANLAKDIAVGMANLRTEAARANTAFTSLSGGANAARTNLDAIKRAAGGTIDSLSAMRIGTQALALGLASNAEQLSKLTTAARAVTFVSPVIRDVGSAISEIGLAAANLSYRRLDQLGLSVTEVKDRIKELQRENGNLTESQAFSLAVVDKLNTKYADLLNSSTAGASGTERLGAAFSDLKIKIADVGIADLTNGLANLAAVGLEKAASGASALGDAYDSLKTRIVGSSDLGELAGGLRTLSNPSNFYFPGTETNQRTIQGAGAAAGLVEEINDPANNALPGIAALRAEVVALANDMISAQVVTDSQITSVERLAVKLSNLKVENTAAPESSQLEKDLVDSIDNARIKANQKLLSQATELAPNIGGDKAIAEFKKQREALEGELATLQSSLIESGRLNTEEATILANEIVANATESFAKLGEVGVDADFSGLTDSLSELNSAGTDLIPGLAELRNEAFDLASELSLTGSATAEQATQLEYLRGVSGALASEQGNLNGIMALFGEEALKNNTQVGGLIEQIARLQGAHAAGKISAEQHAGSLVVLVNALIAAAVQAGASEAQIRAAFGGLQAAAASGYSNFGATPGFATGQTTAEAATARLQAQDAERQRNEQRRVQEQAARKAEQEAERSARQAASIAKRNAAAVERAAEQTAREIESALSKIPGILNISDVTQDQLDAAKAGIGQNFADDWLRRLRDEVKNGADWADVDIKDAAQRAGLDPGLPAEIILKEIEKQWASGQFFANKANLELFNTGAAEEQLRIQKAIEDGRKNVMDYLKANIDQTLLPFVEAKFETVATSEDGNVEFAPPEIKVDTVSIANADVAKDALDKAVSSATPPPLLLPVELEFPAAGDWGFALPDATATQNIDVEGKAKTNGFTIPLPELVLPEFTSENWRVLLPLPTLVIPEIDASRFKIEIPAISVSGGALSGDDFRVTLPDVSVVAGYVPTREEVTIRLPDGKVIPGDELAQADVTVTLPDQAVVKGKIVTEEEVTITLPDGRVLRGDDLNQEDVTVTLPDGRVVKGKELTAEDVTATLPDESVVRGSELTSADVTVTLPDGQVVAGKAITEEEVTVHLPDGKVLRGTELAKSDVTVTLPDQSVIRGKELSAADVTVTTPTPVLLQPVFGDSWKIAVPTPDLSADTAGLAAIFDPIKSFIQSILDFGAKLTDLALPDWLFGPSAGGQGESAPTGIDGGSLTLNPQAVIVNGDAVALPNVQAVSVGLTADVVNIATSQPVGGAGKAAALPDVPLVLNPDKIEINSDVPLFPTPLLFPDNITKIGSLPPIEVPPGIEELGTQASESGIDIAGLRDEIELLDRQSVSLRRSFDRLDDQSASLRNSVSGLGGAFGTLKELTTDINRGFVDLRLNANNVNINMTSLKVGLDGLIPIFSTANTNLSGALDSLVSTIESAIEKIDGVINPAKDSAGAPAQTQTSTALGFATGTKYYRPSANPLGDIFGEEGPEIYVTPDGKAGILGSSGMVQMKGLPTGSTVINAAATKSLFSATARESIAQGLFSGTLTGLPTLPGLGGIPQSPSTTPTSDLANIIGTTAQAAAQASRRQATPTQVYVQQRYAQPQTRVHNGSSVASGGIGTQYVNNFNLTTQTASNQRTVIGEFQRMQVLGGILS